MSDHRLDNLLDAYVAGEAAPAVCDALREALRADAGFRRRLVERALLEVHLYRACSSEAAAPEALAVRRIARRPVRRRKTAYLAAAAAVVIALGAGLAWRLARRPRSPAFHKVVSGSVLVEGSPRDRLRTGEAVRIAGSAPAVVHLADGSRAELDPASEAVLAGRAGRARQVIALDRGGGRFTVRPGAGEFRVETPLGSVTALGTQFTVRLVRGERKEGDRRRSLAVAVAEGSVRVDAAAKSRTLAAGQSCLVAGEEFRADEGRTVRGTVLLVDGARGALVLVSGGDRPRRYDLGLAPQAEVLSDGRPAGIEAIQPGVQVLCRLSADGRTAVSLQAVGPVVAGTIAQVDAAARTVTLASGEDGRQRRTLPVAAGAVVLIHGRPGQLADLRPGVRPAVQLSVDGRTVLEIRVGRPRTEGRAPSAEREVRSGE